MSSLEDTYQRLCDRAREVAKIASIQDLLEWDERTYMPPAGGAYRAEQVAYLAGLAHQRQTDPTIGQWIEELADSPLAEDPHSDTGTVIRQLRRDYQKKTQLPQSLVEELSRTGILGQHAWAEARQASDFSRLQPILEKIVELKRQEAAAYGFERTPYDPLLDDYEPGETTDNISRVLEELRKELVPLVQAIGNSPHKPNVSVLSREYPVAAQEAFGRQVAEAIGYDFRSGRLDETEHPFCAQMGPRDVRITTRYDGEDFHDALFTILHETGHALYDVGLPAADYGLPTGESVSLGIHESQSRLWENQVGRSRGFWSHFFPIAKQRFPAALGDVMQPTFYAAINSVQPSLIRVDADEVTYNLHILIRFELERALIEGDLQVADLPTAWNEKYKEYLNIVPENDAVGVLQDVHWSEGLFGYFPTYTLGNLYAAQFFAKAEEELEGLDTLFHKGEFAPLREWLIFHVHRHGRRYAPQALVEQCTGSPLSHEALIDYMKRKFGEIYQL